jgi:hypothetical protein
MDEGLSTSHPTSQRDWSVGLMMIILTACFVTLLVAFQNPAPIELKEEKANSSWSEKQ